MADLSVIAGITGLVEGMQKGIQYQNRVAMQLREMSMRSQERELERRFRTQATERQEKFRMSMFDKEKAWDKELTGIRFKNQKAMADHSQDIRRADFAWENSKKLQFLKDTNEINLEQTKKLKGLEFKDFLKRQNVTFFSELTLAKAKGDVAYEAKLKLARAENEMTLKNIKNMTDPEVARYLKKRQGVIEQDKVKQKDEVKNFGIKYGVDVTQPGWGLKAEVEKVKAIEAIKTKAEKDRANLNSVSGISWVDQFKAQAKDNQVQVRAIHTTIGKLQGQLVKAKDAFMMAEEPAEKKVLAKEVAEITARKMRVEKTLKDYEASYASNEYKARLFSTPFFRSLHSALPKYAEKEEGKKFTEKNIQSAWWAMSRATTNSQTEQATSNLLSIIPLDETALRSKVIEFSKIKILKSKKASGDHRGAKRIEDSLKRDKNLNQGRRTSTPELTETKEVTPEIKMSLSEGLSETLGRTWGPAGEAIESAGEFFGAGYEKFQKARLKTYRGGPLRGL